SIIGGIDRVAYEDSWTQGLNIDHSTLSSFPWNLADTTTGGILHQMESATRLGDRAARIGYFASTGSDDLFTAPQASFYRMRVETEPLIPVITGSGVRDWTAISDADGAWLSNVGQGALGGENFPRHLRRLWPYRTVLEHRRNYSGRSYREAGRCWYEWHHVVEDRLAHPWMVVFPWVSTHNHFAIMRKRAAPLNSAPVIRLPRTASDSDVVQLTALLNSSLICFWLKQYSNSKGQPRAGQTGTGEPWTLFFEFTSTRLADLPLPPDRWSKDRWSVHAGQLDELTQEIAAADPRVLFGPGSMLTSAELEAARSRWEKLHSRLVSLQEELDWEIYGRYGLVSENEELLAPDEAIPGIAIGERAFEIVLARQVATGKIETEWFARHGSTPITEIPSRWPEPYRQIVRRRIEMIERRRDIALLERPEFKRRWATQSWERREKDAIRIWLLDRSEDRALWYEIDSAGEPRPRPLTIGGLATLLGDDQDFVTMASRYAGVGADLGEVITELIQDEHVPFLAALRYTDAGLRKRAQWEDVWKLQREQDAISRSAEVEVPLPPQYTSADFLKPAYWRQRGKLDVPNERFISYPLAAAPNNEIIIGWAGWGKSERARALIDMIKEGKWSDNDVKTFLVPLLAGLSELLPWLWQWHGDPEPPSWEDGPADEVKAYLESEKAARGLLSDDLSAWRPSKPRRGRPRKTPLPPARES
ncbi:MAG: BREX-2 system adenine-specific DNA-methyltransferase PglX, partial [Streptosporangiaceae bacterium]